MRTLVAGENLAVPAGQLELRVPGPFDVIALVTGDDRKTSGDADFVFYNQPATAGVQLDRDGQGLVLRPDRLRAGASRVTVAVSAQDGSSRLAGGPPPVLDVRAGTGPPLTRFAPQVGPEAVLLLVEVYRRGAGWKLRALGQGYAEGLAGLARDFGLEVLDEVAPAAAPAAPPRAAPSAPVGPPDPLSLELAAVINAVRARSGVPPVTVDARLSGAAAAHSRGMADAGRLGTESGDGVSLFQRVDASGFRCLGLAEHLVSGPRTAAEFAEYCLADAERRAPLLDPALSRVGSGMASGRGDRFWTALWAEPFTPQGLASWTAEVIRLTSAERTTRGLPPLAPEPHLGAAAQAYCEDMVARDFYSHTSPDGTQPWDRGQSAGYRGRGIGENIACGQRTPAEVVEGWMNSPGHRANILKPDFVEIGVGCVSGGRSGTYWCQLFGAP